MAKYRKKPIIVDAFQMTLKRRWDNSEWPTWLHEAWYAGSGEGGIWIDADMPIAEGHDSAAELMLGTLKGPVSIDWGDWIIQGVKGEIYPVKDEIFQLTYDPVPETETDGG
jgi:hypothetical protein